MPLSSYAPTGPVWYGQNTNFDKGDHKRHILASAYAYLDDLWIHGYVSEKAMFPMLEEQMPDVMVHFAQSEMNGAVNLGMVKRAGINTVPIRGPNPTRTQTSRPAPHLLPTSGPPAGTGPLPRVLLERERHRQLDVGARLRVRGLLRRDAAPPGDDHLRVEEVRARQGPRGLPLPAADARDRRQADLAQHRDGSPGHQGRRPRPRLPVRLGGQVYLSHPPHGPWLRACHA